MIQQSGERSNWIANWPLRDLDGLAQAKKLYDQLKGELYNKTTSAEEKTKNVIKTLDQIYALYKQEPKPQELRATQERARIP